MDKSNSFVCHNSDKSRILRAKVQGTGTIHKKSTDISPVHMKSLEGEDDIPILVEVSLNIEDFDFTHYGSDPITAHSKPKNIVNVYCTLCKISALDIKDLKLLVSPAEVDPLVGIALSMVPITSTYNKDSTLIRETVDSTSYCCTGKKCLPLGFNLLNEYLENTRQHTSKRSILAKYIDIMRFRRDSLSVSTIHSDKVIDTTHEDVNAWTEKILMEKIEEFMVDQMTIIYYQQLQHQMLFQ
jgi:hypothetical protein